MGLVAVVRHWRERLFAEKPLGERGERLADRFLRRLGYKIIGRHVRLPSGELDLVALDGRTIVFVEVKTRESDQHGHASEAVTPVKQRRLTRLAVTFLSRHRLHDHPARFDVVAITWPPGEKPRIEHFKNAFEAVGQGEFYS
ncbi:MAG TPA: YraN family protein [Thermoguttaceae bacterium]|nr:YraN family protein [Thermoguttaceae bacterium]